MKALLTVMLVVIPLFTCGGCANMGQPINLELAERNDENVKQVVKDNEFLRGSLAKTLKGDTSWNKDSQGAPLFDDAISGAMGIRNDAAVKVAAEALENARKNNPGK